MSAVVISGTAKAATLAPSAISTARSQTSRMSCMRWEIRTTATLHAAITTGSENRTPVSDSLADFDIFEAIIAHLRPEQAS